MNKRSENTSPTIPSDLLPIILGGDITAYSLARAFHEAYGIKSLVISKAKSRMCATSSILENLVVPDIEEESRLLQELEYISSTIPERRFIVLACGDWYVRILSENKPLLEQQRYIVPYIDANLLNRLVLKDSFYRICEQADIPFPRTYIYDFQNPPQNISLPFNFPVVAKPASSSAYHYVNFPGKRKIYILDNQRQLLDLLGKLQESGYDYKFLIQEFIPGNDTNMRILTCYCDNQSEVRFAAFGQTVLEEKQPMGIGNPVAIIGRKDEAIIAEASRFLKHVGYTGFANFDIKIDPRTGKHYFFEINTRLGRSNYYITGGGNNVAEWLIRDLVFEEKLEGLKIASLTTLYTVVPKAILLKYAEDRQLKDEIRKLYASRKVANPLKYQGENTFMRRVIYPYVYLAKQFKRF